VSLPQSTYRGRVEIEGVYLSSQLQCTPQLCVMVDIVKGGEGANVSIMMECTPESGNIHSVCTLWSLHSVSWRVHEYW
jgi:hypothetical protein